jgi:hypothetical protein
MQVSKINEVVSPSARKIQSTMTEVIEHFKTKGYIPSCSKFERTPDADCFGVVEKVGKTTSGAYDVTTYSSKEQNLISFKQYKNSETFSMEKVDKDENGKVVRHIFDSGEPNKGWKELEEYEYDANKLVKETNFVTMHNHTCKTVKTIDPKTGYYTIEKSYPDLDITARKIEQFNNEGKKIMETYIDENLTRVITRNTQINPRNGVPTAIIEECLKKESNEKIVQKCTLYPSGRVAKYEQTIDGEYLMIEREDCSGKIAHYIDDRGNEFKYNPRTGSSTITTKSGETYSSSQLEAENFVFSVKHGIMSSAIEKLW